MDTIKINKLNALVVAHRGLSGIETENTNAAFVAAGNRSYYGIETDIHRTSDGKFVVIHDYDLNRVAGENVAVELSELSFLQSFILFDKDRTKNRLDLRLCTLENYIGICKKYSKHSVLELKSDFTDKEILRIIEIVKGYDYLDNVTFISFDFENLLKVRKILPNQSVQYLFHVFTDEIVNRLASNKMDADVHYGAITEDIVKQLHNKNIRVNCWTVDDKNIAEKLARWGVDYITSNILE